MRLPKNGLIAAAVMLAGCAVADLIPRQDYVSDVSKPTVSKALTFRQATSQNLGWTYKQGATAKDITSATLVTFTYVPYDRAWSQVVTGALDVATNGSVLVTFTPAQLNTNSGARPFDWLLEVSDGTYVLGYSYGKLTLLEDPSSGVTNTFPTVTTTVDWADVAAYTGTAASGPVRPGTGITTVTNADGSITISAASGGGTGDLTKVVADLTYAPIAITGDLTKAVADLTYDAIGSASAGSNGALSVAASTYLPLAGGIMTGTLDMGSPNNAISNISYVVFGDGGAFKSVAGYPYWMPTGPGGNDYQIWSSYNDGTGSGLDADTLDGNDSTAFAEAGDLANYFPLTGGSGYAVVNAATNNLALEFWTASNRWAYVERYGSTTNVTFITPAR